MASLRQQTWHLNRAKILVSATGIIVNVEYRLDSAGRFQRPDHRPQLVVRSAHFPDLLAHLFDVHDQGVTLRRRFAFIGGDGVDRPEVVTPRSILAPHTLGGDC